MFPCVPLIILLSSGARSQDYLEGSEDDLDSLLVADNITTSDSCEKGWKLRPETRSCYFISDANNQKTWIDAENYCASKFATLLTLGSEDEKMFVLPFMQPVTYYHIGLILRAQNTDDELSRWVDGTNLDTSLIYWDSEEPNSLRGNCVTFRKYHNEMTSEMKKISCADSTAPFVCKKSDVNEPESIDWQCGKFRCCYGTLKRSTYTFAQAKIECSRQKLKGRLPVFRNSFQWTDFLKLKQNAVLDGTKVWLGYQNFLTVNHWTTYDNEEPQFLRFYQNNLDDSASDQQCATTGSDDSEIWRRESCTEKFTTICQMCLETETVDLKSNCSNGWKYVKETKSCYFIADENMRNIWTDSQNFCRMHNADLIVINSIMELNSVSNLLLDSNGYYIGLRSSDIDSNGNRTWEWIDGSPLKTPPMQWKSGEPNNFDDDLTGVSEDCVIIYKEENLVLMHDVSCKYRPQRFICEKNPHENIVQVKGCPDNWFNRPGTQYCYYSSESRVAPANWSKALETCEKLDSHLISFHSREELSFVSNKISANNSLYWVGLSLIIDPISARSWKYVTGRNFHLQDYKWIQDTKFTTGNCVALWDFEELKQISCTQTLGYFFICIRYVAPLPKKEIVIGCPLNWFQFERRCYLNGTKQNSSWIDASNYCNSVGAVLFSYMYDKEFIQATFGRRKYYFFGLYRPSTPYSIRNDYWIWSDGIKYSQSDSEIIQWKIGQTPHTDTSQCTAMTVGRQSHLISRNCSVELAYLCKKNLDSGRMGCPTNWVWSSCHSAKTCQRTCDIPQEFLPSVCYDVCIPGCVCAPGFVQLSVSQPQCIKKLECAEMRLNSSKYCQSGPHEIFENICYRLTTNPLNFDEAEENCRSLGGVLAIVDNFSKLRMLEQMSQSWGITDAFVGLRKTDSLSWHWALDSCKKLFYVPDANNSLWIPGSPDQDEFSTKTVAALRVCEFSPCRGGLMDISRTEELPFICQFNLESEPSSLNSLLPEKEKDIETVHNTSTVAILSWLLAVATVLILLIVWRFRKEHTLKLIQDLIRRGTYKKKSHCDNEAISYVNLMQEGGE